MLLSCWQECAGVLVPWGNDRGLEMELCVLPGTPEGQTKAAVSPPCPPTYTLGVHWASLLPSPKAGKECAAKAEFLFCPSPQVTTLGWPVPKESGEWGRGQSQEQPANSHQPDSRRSQGCCPLSQTASHKERYQRPHGMKCGAWTLQPGWLNSCLSLTVWPWSSHSNWDWLGFQHTNFGRHSSVLSTGESGTAWNHQKEVRIAKNGTWMLKLGTDLSHILQTLTDLFLIQSSIDQIARRWLGLTESSLFWIKMYCVMKRECRKFWETTPILPNLGTGWTEKSAETPSWRSSPSSSGRY